MTDGNKPVKKFSAGGISAAVWSNKKQVNGSEIETSSVTLDRRYKDKDGNWQGSYSLYLNDIPKAIVALSQAYQHLVTKKQSGEEITTEEIAV